MKIWKKYASLFLALVLCLSLAACGGNGDGSHGRKLRDTDVIIDYGMVTRGGEQTIVFAVCDQNAIYLYCDDDEHALFDTAMLPTEELYDRDIWNEDWVLGSMDFRDVTGDNNGDLQATLYHLNMSESNISWHWEEDGGMFISRMAPRSTNLLWSDIPMRSRRNRKRRRNRNMISVSTRGSGRAVQMRAANMIARKYTWSLTPMAAGRSMPVEIR